MAASHGRPLENLSMPLLFGGVQDAAQSVIDAFKSANLVALGARHWAREDSEFRLKLIRNPAFAQTVTDVVVEFANPLYQDLPPEFVQPPPALYNGTDYGREVQRRRAIMFGLH